MIPRSERTTAIATLEQSFGAARAIYLTDINKIDGVKMTELRTELRKNGLSYVVVKNSLARIALDRVGKNSLSPFVVGPVGVVVSAEEPTAPAKVLREFRKQNKDLLEVKASYVEGTLFSAEQTERLADIPSREVLLSQLLSCLQAPVAGMAGVLNGILSKFVGTLEAVKARKESES